MFVLASCNNKNTVKINGEIKGADKQSVYLDRIDVDNILTVDSAKLNSNGRFSFKTTVTDPTYYMLRFGKNEAITIVAEPEKEISVTGNFNKLSENYHVEGSESSAWIKTLIQELRHTQNKLDSLRKSYAALPADNKFSAQRKELEAAWDSILMKQVRFSRHFIIEHAISPALIMLCIKN